MPGEHSVATSSGPLAPKLRGTVAVRRFFGPGYKYVSVLSRKAIVKNND